MSRAALARHAKKRDGNERVIIERFQKYGCTVVQLSVKDVPDLLVSTFSGRVFLVEVKMPGKDLSKGQQAFFDAWPGEKYVVRSEGEVNLIDL
jgi:hypothetical protein